MKSVKNSFHVEFTTELMERAQKQWDIISIEGCTKNGTNRDVDVSKKPDWYDEARFKRGQKWAQHYYTGLVNVSVFGLLVFLQLPIGLAPILATGKSRNLANLFRRYFGTFQHVDLWYHDDPFDPNSESFKSLAAVSMMHWNANKMMNKKISVFEFAKKVLKQQNSTINDDEVIKYIRNKDRVFVSQHDMSLIQWSTLGCCLLEPEASGMHGATREQIIDVIYMWKVIYYKLGIDPKYSLVESMDFDLIVAICKLILEQEYILHMENAAAPAGIRMSEGVLYTFKDILNGSNCNVYLRYWYKVFNVNSYKINRSKDDINKLELFEPSRKNQLTEQEKQIILKNGYNDKYIVNDMNTPFELFKLNGFKDLFLYVCYLLVIGQAMKFDWIRNLSRQIIRASIPKIKVIKKEKMAQFDSLKDKRYEFGQCPFTNGGIQAKY